MYEALLEKQGDARDSAGESASARIESIHHVFPRRCSGRGVDGHLCASDIKIALEIIAFDIRQIEPHACKPNLERTQRAKREP